MADDLIEVLLNRLFDANAKGKLEVFLSEIKSKKKIPFQDLRTSGTSEELVDIVKDAVAANHVTRRELAGLVDEIEENGGQHIFLFDLTADGRKNLTRERLLDALPELPGEPTRAFYAKHPSSTRTYVKDHGEAVVVKQIRTSAYWEKNEAASEVTADRRVEIYEHVRRRAVHSLWLFPSSDQVQIRIDRVRSGDYRSLALEFLNDFLQAIIHVLDLRRDLRPVPIWDGYAGMVASRDETFMNTDDAFDATVKESITNRREGMRGTDVRDHPSYHLADSGYGRKQLAVYWRLPGTFGKPGDNEPPTVYTRMTTVDPGKFRMGKVYVSAKVPKEQLEHVLGRIRHFAENP
jgi:hypothetical protein